MFIWRLQVIVLRPCSWIAFSIIFLSTTKNSFGKLSFPFSLHLCLSRSPAPLFLSSTPIYWFQDFLGKICCPSLSSSSPGFKKCSMLSTFGRTWCYKESLSDNRVSVKHKVYLLMKNCIQTTREHYFLNLILIWHVLKITWSSSWCKQIWCTFHNISISPRLSSSQYFKLGIKLKYYIYRIWFFTNGYGPITRNIVFGLFL